MDEELLTLDKRDEKGPKAPCFIIERIVVDIYTQAVVMGLVEAATEFLPVSSTGHLLLAEKILGFTGPGNNVFEVAIQLGSILAIVVLYWRKLWDVLVGLPSRKEAQAFTAYVLLAFLPSAMLGVVLHGFIKTVLFNPWVVCVSLIVGAFAIVIVEKMAPPSTVGEVEAFGWRRALGIGVGQCFSLIPGVSRSGATILTALMLKVDRKTATEFSFFLSIPTMFGAVAYDLFKSRHDLTTDGLEIIAIGFVVAFVAAIPVVKWLVGFVSRNGLVPFAYYRLAVGMLGLAGLFLLG